MPSAHQPAAAPGDGAAAAGGEGGGTTHAVSVADAQAGAKLSTRPEQHWSRPPGADPHPPPPHWPQAAGQHAWPLRMPFEHQASVVPDGAGGGDESGTTHTVSASVSHIAALAATRPEQHWSGPPGALPQPPPPHWPQEAGQHASPLGPRMPSAHQPRKAGGDGGGGEKPPGGAGIRGGDETAAGGEGGGESGTTHATSVGVSHIGA